MAKFSQTFLQGLLNSPMQEGLFEAAKGLGQTPAIMGLQKERKEQQNKMEEIISGGPTLERIAQLRSMAASMAVTNPKRAKALVTAATNMQKQYDAEQTKKDQQFTGMAQKIASDATIGNIAEYVDGLNIPAWRKPTVLKQATEQRKLMVSAQENADVRTLSDDYQNFIKKHRSILDENPAFQTAMSVMEREDGNFAVGERLLAAKTIRAIVDKEIERQSTAQFTTASVQAQATGFINNFIEQDSISAGVWGRDAVEAAREVFNSEEFRDEFVKFVGAEYEKSPNITAELAVKNALDFMGEKYSDKLEFGRLINIEEDVSLKEQREEIIVYLMDKEDLSRKEAIREINRRQAALAIEEQNKPVVPPLPPADTTPPPAATTPPMPPGRNPRLSYPAVTPEQAQRRNSVSQGFSTYNREAAQRREDQSLFTGGRPTRN